jgi:hypothetical protein
MRSSFTSKFIRTSFYIFELDELSKLRGHVYRYALPSLISILIPRHIQVRCIKHFPGATKLQQNLSSIDEALLNDVALKDVLLLGSIAAFALTGGWAPKSCRFTANDRRIVKQKRDSSDSIAANLENLLRRSAASGVKSGWLIRNHLWRTLAPESEIYRWDFRFQWVIFDLVKKKFKFGQMPCRHIKAPQDGNAKFQYNF